MESWVHSHIKIGFIITDKGKIVALDGLTTSFGSLAIIGVNKRIGRLRSQ